MQCMPAQGFTQYSHQVTWWIKLILWANKQKFMVVIFVKVQDVVCYVQVM
jgi:hypothetical protein